MSDSEPMKRGILSKVAKIYDPLQSRLNGQLSTVKLATTNVLGMPRCSRSWLEDGAGGKSSSLPRQIPRALPRQQEPINDILLHAFGDASGKGVAAAVYAVMHQPTQVYQELVACRARLAKQGLTIPRLELVSGNMAVSLVNNVRSELQGFPFVQVY